MHELDEEERARLGAQVDHFLAIIAERYGLSMQDVVAAVRWVESRRQMSSRVTFTATMSILGIVISAVLAAVWQGLLHVLGRHQ